MISVAGLRIAPVKGLAALPRAEVQLDLDGVAEDRRLFLLRADGSVLTIGRCPRLALVRPELDLATGSLTMTFPDGTTATDDLAHGSETILTQLFDKDRRGRVVPGAVGEALSAFVGEPVRLVLAERTGVGWDEGPVSLLGRASAEAVSTPWSEGKPQTARYRMLIEIDGSTPFQEDSWVGGQVRLGQALVHVTHALERCAVINANPGTAVSDWSGVQTLAVRRGRDQLTLGVIARVIEPGPVRLGDAVQPAVAAAPGRARASGGT